MAVANLGSIASDVIAEYPDITAGPSGALIKIADRQRLFMEERTGLTIGSTGIAERFQPALFYLTAAAALEASKLDGANAGVIELGDFRTEKRGDDNITTVAGNLKKEGLEKLRELGTKIHFRRVIG